ncbi:hypothetical protein [Rhizobium sp. Root482]|uniref:hypothetical protein n=1 Tax=Rhizobium sp. Root482 TaxID=1736543 RepID=UPI0006F6BB2F|nr:hypothetical protein [Rhizobium sp. Root482]KQY14614.1 hypothetical protein ASD31_10210 [Rhizobium sp. Root482]
MNETEFVALLNRHIADLAALSIHQAFEDSVPRYQDSAAKIQRLLTGQVVDGFGEFLKRFPQTDGWLPERPEDLDPMPASEIYFRLVAHRAGERWVENALLPAFQTGTYLRALEKLRDGVSELKMKPNTPEGML